MLILASAATAIIFAGGLDTMRRTFKDFEGPETEKIFFILQDFGADLFARKGSFDEAGLALVEGDAVASEGASLYF